MAFDRKLFQKINGFSTGYIYGHYEDADLSIRWREANGPVAIHPHLTICAPRGPRIQDPRRLLPRRIHVQPALLHVPVRRTVRQQSRDALKSGGFRPIATIAAVRHRKSSCASSMSATCIRLSPQAARSRSPMNCSRRACARATIPISIAALEVNHQEVYGKPGAVIVPMPGEDRQFFYFTQFYDYYHLSVQDPRTIQFFRELIERLKPDVIHFHHYHRIGVESIRAAPPRRPQRGDRAHAARDDGDLLRRRPDAEEAVARALPWGEPDRLQQVLPRPAARVLHAARLPAQGHPRRLRRVRVPSEFIAERYTDWGLPPEKCVVIENGQIDLGVDFDRKQHSPAVNRFGFFGQFIDNKGVDVILEALLILARDKKVPPEGVVVEINGGNKHYATQPYLEKIAQYGEALKKISPSQISVRERGSYDREQLQERMSSIDWVMVPSTWWEIFGLVVSEAWMFGRPVIASDIAALRDRVQDGVNGFKFPARNAQALADLDGQPDRRRAAVAERQRHDRADLERHRHAQRLCEHLAGVQRQAPAWLNPARGWRDCRLSASRSSHPMLANAAGRKPSIRARRPSFCRQPASP